MTRIREEEVDSNVVPAGKRDKAVSFVVGIVSRTLSVFIPVKELVVWEIFHRIWFTFVAYRYMLLHFCKIGWNRDPSPSYRQMLQGVNFMPVKYGPAPRVDAICWCACNVLSSWWQVTGMSSLLLISWNAVASCMSWTALQLSLSLWRCIVKHVSEPLCLSVYVCVSVCLCALALIALPIPFAAIFGM